MIPQNYYIISGKNKMYEEMLPIWFRNEDFQVIKIVANYRIY